ncbi:MAG: Wzt carbohydrate-binding domain-containing protein, partial [Anaerolineae bacterium]
VFVSHNIRQVERLCDHVIYLKKGEIILAGDSQTVCQEYIIRAVREYQETISEELSDGAVIRSSGEMELVRVETLDLTGRVTETFNPGDPFKIRICYDAHERIENPIIGANIKTSEMIKLTNFQIVPSMVEQPFYALEGEGGIEFTIPHMPFNPDCYTVGVTIRSENGRRIISGQSLATFCVEYDPDYATRLGLVHLDFSWELNP